MTDRRTIRTKEKIRNAIKVLLDETTYDRINVTDITERAGINRVTFYTHYQDKDDALKDVIDNFVAQCSESALELAKESHYSDDPSANFNIVHAVAFINFFIKHKDLLRSLSKTENVAIYTTFQKSLFERLFQNIIKIMPGNVKAKYPFSYDFIIAGYNSIIFKWIQDEYCSESEFYEQVEKLTRDITNTQFLFTHD